MRSLGTLANAAAVLALGTAAAPSLRAAEALRGAAQQQRDLFCPP